MLQLGIMWLLALVLASAPVALGRFTFYYRACWRRNCVLHNDADTVCFDSSDNGADTPPCDDATLLNLLSTHVHSPIGLSIAYYDERGAFLGPSTWSVPDPLPFPIFVCMSGRRTDVEGPLYRTICRTAMHDNDTREADAHRRECSASVPQKIVTDGCYNPSVKAVQAVLDLPASGFSSSSSSSFLDNPLLNHMFFVLGAVTTIAALYSMVLQFRKPVLSALGRVVDKLRRNHQPRQEDNIEAPLAIDMRAAEP
ncbi:hypothetical protein EXIGLDRAFT_717222 [Exidia glandulosa HHB12029]|uniref:Membrane-associated protein n=1 Tax=Exidia glandulosa HHB12029 TaxID=1314781 RepID=A0A165P4L3_EXIGL|nr:hypothetical protein EXIGLDRAFT_717222 [Exidia glandulosa HHB12029]